MDREAWRAAVHGVAKTRTRLSDELNRAVCDRVPRRSAGPGPKSSGPGAARGRRSTVAAGLLGAWPPVPAARRDGARVRAAPLPQGLLDRRRVCGVCRAGAERRTENVETCETPRARAPAAARVTRPGPAGPETLPPGILPPGRHPKGSRRSPSQPSGSLSSGSRFSPQALWGGTSGLPRRTPQLRFSEAASWCGSLVSEAALQSLLPREERPSRPLRMPLRRETPFPEAAAWRLSPPPAPCLPQTPRRCELCPNRRADPPPFLHLLPWAPFSPCHQPSPAHPGLTAAPRLWGDRTCGGGRWADSCCGPALPQVTPPPALSQKDPPLRHS